MGSSTYLPETRTGTFVGAIRSFGIFLLVAGVTSVHFFTTPTPIRLANVVLAAGLILTLGSLWPIRDSLIARFRVWFQTPGSGVQILRDLGVWLTSRMAAIEARTKTWHVAAVLAALFLLSVVGSRGGILDVELDQYIPHYLSNKPFFARTFDSTMVDVDPGAPEIIWHGRKVHMLRLQRPRPFSNFVDCLDAEAIAWSVSKGHPHLLSVSFVIFLLMNYLIVWVFCRRYLKFDVYTSGLLVCVLASDPVLACNLSYFRSAKTGTSTFLLAALCLVAVLLVRRRPAPTGFGRTAMMICVPLFLLTACMFDEQAIFMTAILAATLFIEWRFPAGVGTSSTARSLLFSSIAVIAAYGIYALAIHSRLCVYFADTPPLMALEYQAGAVRGLALEFFSRTWQALFLLVDQFRFLTGCQLALPAVLMMLWMGATAASCTAVVSAPGRPDKGEGARRGILRHLIIAATLVVLTLAALCSRHEWLLRYDMRRWLYSEPTTMVLMMFLMLTTAAVLGSRRFSRPVVQLVLLGMFIGNMWTMPEHRRFLRSGYWMPRLDISIDFIDALKKPAGEKVPPEVAASPAFQALRTYVPVK